MTVFNLLDTPRAASFQTTNRVLDVRIVRQQLSAQLLAEAHPGEHGHRQMTVFHGGATTMVLFVFEDGGALADHKANGLVTIQVLDGALTVIAEEQTHALGAGHLLVLRSGVPHSVTAHQASRMLLTVQLEKAAAS